jgi:hypothetical protein
MSYKPTLTICLVVALVWLGSAATAASVAIIVVIFTETPLFPSHYRIECVAPIEVDSGLTNQLSNKSSFEDFV